MKNSDEQRKIPYSFIIFFTRSNSLITMGKIGEGWSRAEGRRVGPLEVGRPIPAASAGGLQELVPAGRRPNDRDPLALA